MKKKVVVKETKAKKAPVEKKLPAKAAAVKKKVKQDIQYNGPYPNLIKFMLFLKANYAREMAVESLKNAKEMELPLMKLFAHVSEEALIAQSLKGFEDNVSSLIDGSYIERQKMSMKLWEEDKLPGISRDNIKPSDLVLVYASQKKTFLTFLPLYTQDMKEVIAIIQQSDDLNLKSQEAAINLMFRLSKEAEERAIRTAELLKESEEKFQKAFQSSGAGITITRLSDSTYVDVNDGFIKMTGFSKEELIGNSSVSVGLIGNVEEREKLLQHVRRFDSARNIELTIRNKSGKTINVITSIETIILGGEKYALNIMYDISARKKAEEELIKVNTRLSESTDFLESVLENLPNMVFVKDATDLRFIKFNKAGEKLLGLSRDELIGKNDYDFFPKEQADFFTQKDHDVIKGDDVVDIAEEPIDTKNGKRWLHTRKIPIKNIFGNPLYLVGISEDITEKRQAVEHIKQLNNELGLNLRQLETVNKELEAFSYSVSHDLRSPLRAIHGYSKILLDEYVSSLGEDGSSMLNAVMSNTIKMGQLIDDLLAFSRMGKKEMNIMEVDMEELAKVALHEVASSYAGMEKVKITINKLLPAKADYALMEQVFANLISNAVKYSSKNEEPVVEISSYEANGEKVYSVKDNGVGFDMRYYNKLFGVFQRLHTQAEFDGTGVGLALVKRILTRHNGRVWAEAEPNKGATFYIALSN
ncbi:MAG TPA: PAS domain S-box protein [Bacteroidia bacterium]|jgi:PAS domain S-box-containing protein|nr:PAS domain S-box protein [Bacteroidia bacterium]